MITVGNLNPSPLYLYNLCLYLNQPVPLFLPVSRGHGRQDCLMLVLELQSICSLTFCSLDGSECKSIAVRGQRRWDTQLAGVLFMSQPCWVGSYSASKSQMWFNLCSIHCPDCWLLITSKVPGCWISVGALCYGAQSVSLIAQRSITRPWKQSRDCLLELIGIRRDACSTFITQE